MSRAMIDAAMTYAARGWPVFPCKPGQKEPNTEHGFKDATTDRAAIRNWWTRHPQDNVAIATGAPGPDVIDVDVKGGVNGYVALNKLRRAGLLTGAGLLVRTPSGGLHLYFAGTGQECGRLPEHGLDFKAHGGYVLAPPSVIGDRCYELGDERVLSATHTWPAARNLLRPQQPRIVMGPRSSSIEHLAAWVARLTEGNRNNGLYWAACRAIETGSDPEPLIAASALDEAEARRTVASAARRAAV
jgi:hypothetical protein